MLRWLALLALLPLPGCVIYFGDGDDDGPPRVDAGWPPVDAGWPPVDAGWPPVDAGWGAPDAAPADAGCGAPDAAPEPPGPVVTPPAPGVWELAFVGGTVDDPVLHLGNLGGESTPLVHLGGGAILTGQASGAPDGRHVAYVTFEHDWHLHVIDLRTGVDRDLAPVVGFGGPPPAWSPDGKLLAYAAFTAPSWTEVAVVAADGASPPRRLALFDTGLRDCMGPTFTTDGTAVVFASPTQLVAVDLASGQRRVVATPPSNTRFCRPAVSPDGATVAVRVVAGFSASVATVPLAGGAVQIIASDAEPNTGATVAWRPDGSSLAYVATGAEGEPALRIVPAAGGPSQLVDDELGWMPPAPVWSPDGRYLLYQQAQPTGRELWALDTLLGGRFPTGLVTLGLDASGPSWLGVPLVVE